MGNESLGLRSRDCVFISFGHISNTLSSSLNIPNQEVAIQFLISGVGLVHGGYLRCWIVGDCKRDANEAQT